MTNLVHLHRLREIKPNIASKISIESDTDCWLWQGFIMANGYPYFGSKRAHRIIWKLLIGPLTQKQHLHHICQIKHCVNPNHLEKIDSASHNRHHQIGRPLIISEKERERRIKHGKAMIHHAQGKSYSKRTRQDVSKEMWSKRTPEERAEIGRKISAAKRGDA